MAAVVPMRQPLGICIVYETSLYLYYKGLEHEHSTPLS